MGKGGYFNFSVEWYTPYALPLPPLKRQATVTTLHINHTMLVAIVSYCSNERCFIDDLLHAATACCDLVCVAVGSRMYDGTEEVDVSDLRLAHPTVMFARYDVPDELLSTPVELHNRARATAFRCALDSVNAGDAGDAEDAGFWTLFLDGDEVPRDGGSSVSGWWDLVERGAALDTGAAYKMACRWFFMDRGLVSERLQDSILLVHSSTVRLPGALRHPRERDGIIACMPSDAMVAREVKGVDGEAMFDHFSWVRNDRADLIRKVKNWGHVGQKPWSQMICDALDSISRGVDPPTDFVHGIPLRRIHPRDASALRPRAASS